LCGLVAKQTGHLLKLSKSHSHLCPLKSYEGSISLESARQLEDEDETKDRSSNHESAKYKVHRCVEYPVEKRRGTSLSVLSSEMSREN
jgi:hypothetical protein